jgi:WD40 repeat protein
VYDFSIRNYFSSFPPALSEASIHTHQSPITATAVFRTGEKLILITGDKVGKVKAWDMIRGDFLRDFPVPVEDPDKPASKIRHTKKITAVGICESPGDDNLVNLKIVTTSENKVDDDGQQFPCVIIWDFSTSTALRHFMYNQTITSLVVNSKSRTCIFASIDKAIHVWNIENESPFVKIATDHSDMILSLSIILKPDALHGKANVDIYDCEIVSVGWDKRMFKYSYRSNLNRWIPVTFGKGHTKSITCMIAHYPCGEEDHNVRQQRNEPPILITGSLDKTAIIWDYETGTKVRVLTGHEGQINAVKVVDRDDDGSPPIVITAGRDCRIILWDLVSGSMFRNVLHDAPLTTLVVSESYSGMILFASAEECSKVLIWDLRRTVRSRKLKAAKGVTVIDVKENKANGRINDIYIGCVDEQFHIYDLNSATNHRGTNNTHKFHEKRINIGIQHEGIFVSGDGGGMMAIWSLDTHQRLIDNIKVDEQMLLTIALYDPQLFGRDKLATGRTSTKTENSKKYVDLSKPCVLTGGGDRKIKVWDFLGVPDIRTQGTLIAEVSSGHLGYIRSIVVYHPVKKDHAPLFISGSYDKTVILWKLQTLEKLRVFKDYHTDYVFFTAIYDPNVQFANSTRLANKKDNDHLQPAIITTSYDGKVGIWDMFTSDDYGSTKDSESSDTDPVPEELGANASVEEVIKLRRGFVAHKDSVTALTMFYPQNDIDAPLIITGSIDQTIVIWNFFTMEKIQTLLGHSNRVCWLKVYINPSNLFHPVLLSGSDDEYVIVWEDSLYQKPFMPLREIVRNAFISDLETNDWPLITEMVTLYKGLFFTENSNLFLLAVKNGRSDFLIKFWDYLVATLPTMKKAQFRIGNPDVVNSPARVTFSLRDLSPLTQVEAGLRRIGAFRHFSDENLNAAAVPANGATVRLVTVDKELDILLLAIKKCDLLAVRAITLAWVKNLNKDMDSMLTQRLYHPSYNLSDESIEALYDYYPSEFVFFIKSLKLIRNHFSLMTTVAEGRDTVNDEVNQMKDLSRQDRYELRGSSFRINKYGSFWTADDDMRKYVKEDSSLPDDESVDGAVNNQPRQSATNLERFTKERLSFGSKLLIDFDSFILKNFINFKKFFSKSIPPQPVTSLMLPFHNCDQMLKYLKWFVEVSNQLDNVEVFNSEISKVMVNYVWHIRARRAHVLSFACYLLFFMLFLICMYDYQPHFHNYPGLMFLNILTIVGFAWYTHEEYSQIRKIRIDPMIEAAKENNNHIFNATNTDDNNNSARDNGSVLSWKAVRNALILHFTDLWNFLDLTTIICGITGLLLRLFYGRDTPTGRSFLAITSVCMWFKILYFLRPFSTTGPLGNQIFSPLCCVLLLILFFSFHLC